MKSQKSQSAISSALLKGNQAIFDDAQKHSVFDKPRKVISEETGEEVILKKDPKTKKVIGFEKLNFISGKGKIEDLPVEVELDS